MALTALVFGGGGDPSSGRRCGQVGTFTKDVAPIFQQKCESCHRPNNMARCRS